MQIINHKLSSGWYQASPHHGGTLHEPTLLVMHFTASGGSSPKADADYFLTEQAQASAHVIVGRDGSALQVVPFNQKAWHAGKSVWRGVPNCNDYSIGVEIDNWGRLLRSADGQARSWSGEAVDSARVAELVHKHETAPALWEIYAERQLDALVDLTRQLLKTYPSISEIVGHDDIAPGRKVDPGPAFPMSRFTSLVAGRGNVEMATRTVIASHLNARGGPGLSYEVLGVFAKGQEVRIIYDSPGPWTQVAGALTDGSPVTAWVADQYLR